VPRTIDGEDLDGYNNTYGKTDSFTGIQQTTDGYLVWGRTESLTPKTYAAAWLLKLNESGREEWNQTYANGRDRSINDVFQRGEDEVIVVGRGDDSDSEGAWLASLATNGELRWERTYGGSIDRFESIAGLDQSGYLVSGSSWTCSQEDSYADFSLTKIRPNTSVKWTSHYGGLRADQAYETVSPRTGRLLLVGSTSSFGDNGWVVEVPIDPDVLPIGPSYRPPQDPDSDGLFEDFNGDGELNSKDSAVLFDNRDSDRVRSSGERFDFNNDGLINILDVQALSELPRVVGSNGTAGVTSVALSPMNATVVTGERATVQVVVETAAGGVGAQNITVRTNTTVAMVEDTEPRGSPSEATANTIYGADNASVTIVMAQADTADVGAVVTATVSVAGRTVGTTDLNLTVTALGNETGTSYVVSSVTNASVTVNPGHHESGVSHALYNEVAGQSGQLQRPDIIDLINAYIKNDGQYNGLPVDRLDVIDLINHYLYQST
jgi:hypothetical protein